MNDARPNPRGRSAILLNRPPGLTFLWLAGSVLFLILYTAISTTLWPKLTFGRGIVMALTNVVPLSVLAAAARAVLKTYVMDRGVATQAMAHLAIAPLFATTWYFAILVLQSAVTENGGGDMRLQGFSGVALAWQTFQGLVIYALVASLCYAVRGGSEASVVSFVAEPPSLDRYLIRTGDELIPVRIDSIVSIVGAQDYSEVATVAGGCHLVRLSLAEFERRLDRHRFVRVHRSTIINLDELERLEPAGNGRMIAHLSNGTPVEVSRAGTQLLRSFVV